MEDELAPLKTAILDLLADRQPGASICPGEAARKRYPENWRENMPACREAAVDLAGEGEIQILQKGEPVDPRHFNGPIRLRLPEEGPKQRKQ